MKRYLAFLFLGFVIGGGCSFSHAMEGVVSIPNSSEQEHVHVLLQKLAEMKREPEPIGFLPTKYHPIVQDFCRGVKGEACLKLYNGAIASKAPELIAALDWVVARCVPIDRRQLVAEALTTLLDNPTNREVYTVCEKVLQQHACAQLLTITNPREHLPAIVRCLTLLCLGCEKERSIYDAITENPRLIDESRISLEEQRLTSLFGIDTLPATLTLLDLSKNFFIGDQLYAARAPFNFFKQLEELKLLQCNMTVIPAGFFEGLPSLKRLLIAKNCLKMFPDVSLCPALEMVNIGDNQIAEFKPIKGNMSSLYCAPHIFTELNPDHLRGLPRLRTICLSEATLSEPSKAALKEQLPNLQVIYTKK